MANKTPELEPVHRLPDIGVDRPTVLKLLREAGRGDANYRGGKTWSLVYYLGEEYTKFLKEAHGLYFSENGLNPMAFISLKRFEADVVRMAAAMLHGDQNVVGTMTSGGTESCLLAVKTYRDMARAKKRWLDGPEMIVPRSVHVAFAKAAEYFGVKAVQAPLDASFRVDVRAVRRLINRRTVLIVGSAPTYPHGVVDPIEELGALAQRRGVPLHVDACLGGFLLPFVEELGGDVQPFDFRVPGVQSMSADVHKYGFAAKGASVVLYRDMDVLKHQFFVSVDWPGGLFASPALLGTRPGGSIAAAWAAMMAMGRKGYLDNARTIMRIARKLLDGIRAIPELQVIGDPPMSVFAYGAKSRRLNIFAVGDQLERRGWHIDRIQRPDALHAMVTPWHARIADEFLRDLRDSVEYVKAHPEAALEGGAPMYGMSSKAPIRGLVRQAVLKMMMEMYGPQTIIPDPANPPDDWGARAGKYYLQLRERLADLWEEAGAEVARRVGRGRR